MDRRRRHSKSKSRSRCPPTATSRFFRRRRRWGRASPRPTPSSRSMYSTSGSRRSGSCKATPTAGTGFGSAGSRSLFVGGSAVLVAAERTVGTAQELAAAALEAAITDIEYADGVFTVAGTDHRVGLFELARRQAQHRNQRRIGQLGRRVDVAERLSHLRSRSRSRHGSGADRRLRVGERRRPRGESAYRARAARRRRGARDGTGADVKALSTIASPVRR